MDHAIIENGVVTSVYRSGVPAPSGAIEVPNGVFAGFIDNADGTFSAPAPPPPTQDVYALAVQGHIDNVARTRGYSDGYSLASYVTSSNVGWASEAATFVRWRDDVWEYVFAQLAAVQSQQRLQPTPQELLTEIAEIVWP